MNTNELDQPTPGPWRWVFVSTAGQWFMLGNNGEGPIVSSGPDTADGRLKQAAPALLAACEMAFEDLEQYEDTDLPGGYAVMETVQTLRAAIAEARGETG